MTLTGKRVVIAALFSAREPDPARRMASLGAQVSAAGGIVVGEVVQRRGVSRDARPGGARRLDQPLSPTTLVGSGKARELADLCAARGADVVVFRNPLSPRQRDGLGALCRVAVHDAAELGLVGE